MMNKFEIKDNRTFKQRAADFGRSAMFWKGRKKGMIHTRDITLNDLREVFFPKDFNEKYGYLGYIYASESSDAGNVIRPLILAMDKKAKPKWCPRWFLRLLDLFGNDKSIVRVRNRTLSNLHRKLTKGYRFIDWKTKWDWYDLRISIYGCQELQDMAHAIERDYYAKGKQEEALVELMEHDKENGLYVENEKKQSSVNNKEEQPSKAPKSAKEMFLAEPKPDVAGKPPIVKLTQEQLKDVGL